MSSLILATRPKSAPDENSSNSQSDSTAAGEGGQLRVRCRRCGQRFTSKSDYQEHLQSKVSKHASVPLGDYEFTTYNRE